MNNFWNYLYLDHHIYEGTWARTKDGSKIHCSIRFDGKLRCKWEESATSNIVEVSKTSLTWDRDPNITGTFDNDTITWSNGSIWEKIGKSYYLLCILRF